MHTCIPKSVACFDLLRGHLEAYEIQYKGLDALKV